MCGIAGLFGSRLPAPELRSALEAMNHAQAHRGPDEEGILISAPHGAGLASRRLSIVDLQSGHQPVSNEDSSIHVVLNGEIYNHVALRRELERNGHRFRSRSDTEVLVHLYEDLGDAFLEKLQGMFALALLDTRQGRLLLARDGPGMKPLYVAETPHGLLFASEAKALFATCLVAPAPDPAGLDSYLALGYVPAPMTVFRGVRKLRAGRFLVAQGGAVREAVFWRFRYRDDEAVHSEAEHADHLEHVLRAAVRSHLAADVPVGAFLSGGWDSSLTAALAAQQSGGRLKTFSIVFPEDPQMDESRYSRLMARELGTDHHEIEYRAARFPEILSKLTRHLDEPCSAVPVGVVYMLASLAAQHVKTVISGEGADELFGGYEWMRFESPYWIRRVTPHWPFLLASRACPHQRVKRALRILGAASDRAADVEWRRKHTPEEKRSLLKPEYRSNGPDIQPAMLSDEALASCSDSLQRRLGFDFRGRLADGTLFMADKVSMAHSLEVRMPFLDVSVVDLALGLPSRLKVSRGREKILVSMLAERLLPPEIARRRKHGLGYPLGSFARGPLAKFARQFLLDSAAGGPFERRSLERYLEARLARGRGNRAGLQNLVMLQSWWNEFIL